MTTLTGLFTKIGNFIGDVAKGSAAIAVLPLKSIQGKETKVKFRTKVGKAVAGGAVVGAQSVNIAAKAWADGITGGYASKAANLIRKDENKESIGNYSEQRGSIMGGSGLLSKFENFSKFGNRKQVNTPIPSTTLPNSPNKEAGVDASIFNAKTIAVGVLAFGVLAAIIASQKNDKPKRSKKIPKKNEKH